MSEGAGDERGTRIEGASGGTELLGEELVLAYDDEPVVDGESVVVPRGRVTALVGPNGSGKSTLLRGLADQLTPEAGAVRLDGRDISELGTKELARRLGVLSQEHTAPESITVENLVYHGRYPHRGFFEGIDEADVAAVERALELTGIDHLRDRSVGELSGGQKQLAWIAVVLAQETDVLLLDEPTTFLDLHHQLEVMDVVRTLNREADVTVVVVLHDINQAARHADYMLALKEGAIYARGPPAEVVTEDLLADVFRVEATVREGPEVVPHRPVEE